VEVIEGDLYVVDNFSMAAFTGLETLTSVEGDFVLVRSDSLTDFSGLDNLNTIGGSFSIGTGGNTGYYGNMALTSFNGLVSLDSIGANLEIHNNSNLIGLTGLDSLTFIGGDFSIVINTSLLSLTGIDSVDAGSINNLEIKYNFSLSDCDAQSICEYLASPNGAITIAANDTGCDNQQEVQDDCDSITSVSEIIAEETFTISPNPLESTSVIKYTIPYKSPVTIKIFDLTGVEIKTLVNETQQKGKQQIIFFTGDLPTGIYFCVLKTNNGMQTKKIIKL